MPPAKRQQILPARQLTQLCAVSMLDTFWGNCSATGCLHLWSGLFSRHGLWRGPHTCMIHSAEGTTVSGLILPPEAATAVAPQPY